ncbi:cryptochrome/photolyase family protein [Haloparvum sedimenti]|uniref:cryptochrome/photolyase family protein n=1 Tax=Haloparvum sedimenti TaxID=1678448 RepID=UPI00071E7D35|nr:deoxyribodipyrimidine photo-lyase [Haloparvum sedimenti]
MELFWHRRDLRVADNVGLAAAADRDAVASVFVFDDAVLEHAGAPRVGFLLDALDALRAAYRDRGSDLLLARGDPTAVVPALADELDAERVVWNRDYSGLARRRDAAVRQALDEADVPREAHHDAVLHTPDSIRTNAGDPYSVYTYYWKKWDDREADGPAPTPDGDDLASADEVEGARGELDALLAELPTPADLGFAEPDADLPEAGTAAARERLEEFLADDVFRYAEARDYPAESATSRLSQDLKYGTIGVREAYAATEEALDAAADRPEADAAESVEEFQGQLAWREFYTQVLYHNPEVVTENYKSYEEPIAWREDADALGAWKAGETGYPIVDAGMRQLRAEAYMHNRVRMIVAAFLTKDLLIDWREGYAHFRERLVDHDTANDNGGWQWAASTGTDAQPYFRIFNPMTQGERYDPDAAYITEYVPELRGVDPETIHSWHELSQAERDSAAPDYPAPIVDHSERRDEAMAMFKRARGEDPEESG